MKKKQKIKELKKKLKMYKSNNKRLERQLNNKSVTIKNEIIGGNTTLYFIEEETYSDYYDSVVVVEEGKKVEYFVSATILRKELPDGDK